MKLREIGSPVREIGRFPVNCGSLPPNAGDLTCLVNIQVSTKKSRIGQKVILHKAIGVLLLPYKGLGLFRALKVQSKLVRLGGGGVCSLKTVKKKNYIK